MVTQTDRVTERQGEYSAICLFEGWKIEGRDLQLFYFHVYAPQCMIQNGGFGWLYVKEE